ncbi:MAG: response regulator [Azonexus sp.]|nr:response regulator [Azonexus sp.]
MDTPASPLLLIVDDSRMSRMLIRAIVTDQRPSWRLIEAASGDEAVALVEQETPDFVSMDVNMPGISGLEAAGRIRIKHPQTRIVMCTANIQESTREAAAKVGLHFVAKPITPASIADAIAYFER